MFRGDFVGFGYVVLLWVWWVLLGLGFGDDLFFVWIVGLGGFVVWYCCFTSLLL